MISLEQVRALEGRVEKAVAYIASLREECAELGRRLAEAQGFIDEAANEVGAAEEKAAAAEEKTAAAEEKAAAAEKRADAAESLRLAEANRIREFESRLADMAERVAAAETRAAELNARAEEYRKDQVKIEEGIIHALEKLDSFEDLVLSQASLAVEKAEEPAPEPASLGSGIAVKSLPESEEEAKDSPADGGIEVEPVENELDIF
jgi:chromosome segregation ATPase